MDFADVCMVAMAEQVSDCLVLTLERQDFSVYRRHERAIDQRNFAKPAIGALMALSVKVSFAKTLSFETSLATAWQSSAGK